MNTNIHRHAFDAKVECGHTGDILGQAHLNKLDSDLQVLFETLYQPSVAQPDRGHPQGMQLDC
jgi:hypothetical protein